MLYNSKNNNKEFIINYSLFNCLYKNTRLPYFSFLSLLRNFDCTKQNAENIRSTLALKFFTLINALSIILHSHFQYL